MLNSTKSRHAGKTFLQTLFFFFLVTQICYPQWYQQNSGTSDILNSIHFEDANIGWAVSYGGAILHTSDGGNNWNVQASNMGGLNSVYFTSPSEGWAVGGNYYITILHTTDGGINWIEQNGGLIMFELTSVFSTSSTTGWAVGWNCVILHTTDGGDNWTQQSSSIGNSLYAVYFASSTTGWAVGWNSIIIHTTDGGDNWYEQASGMTDVLFSVYFTSPTTGWAVGSNGTILNTTNGGATFVEEEGIDETPSTYFLSNNFPNPFNPSTKIQYSIPQSTNVTIKMLDVLGNEIETLVNEEKPAGTYELTWSAENLPSGVYFYQLKAGEFVFTKKMILLK